MATLQRSHDRQSNTERGTALEATQDGFDARSHGPDNSTRHPSFGPKAPINGRLGFHTKHFKSGSVSTGGSTATASTAAMRLRESPDDKPFALFTSRSKPTVLPPRLESHRTSDSPHSGKQGFFTSALRSKRPPTSSEGSSGDGKGNKVPLRLETQSNRAAKAASNPPRSVQKNAIDLRGRDHAEAGAPPTSIPSDKKVQSAPKSRGSIRSRLGARPKVVETDGGLFTSRRMLVDSDVGSVGDNETNGASGAEHMQLDGRDSNRSVDDVNSSNYGRDLSEGDRRDGDIAIPDFQQSPAVQLPERHYLSGRGSEAKTSRDSVTRITTSEQPLDNNVVVPPNGFLSRKAREGKRQQEDEREWRARDLGLASGVASNDVPQVAASCEDISPASSSAGSETQSTAHVGGRGPRQEGSKGASLQERSRERSVPLVLRNTSAAKRVRLSKKPYSIPSPDDVRVRIPESEAPPTAGSTKSSTGGKRELPRINVEANINSNAHVLQSPHVIAISPVSPKSDVSVISSAEDPYFVDEDGAGLSMVESEKIGAKTSVGNNGPYIKRHLGPVGSPSVSGDVIDVDSSNVGQLKRTRTDSSALQRHSPLTTQNSRSRPLVDLTLEDADGPMEMSRSPDLVDLTPAADVAYSRLPRQLADNRQSSHLPRKEALHPRGQYSGARPMERWTHSRVHPQEYDLYDDSPIEYEEPFVDTRGYVYDIGPNGEYYTRGDIFDDDQEMYMAPDQYLPPAGINQQSPPLQTHPHMASVAQRRNSRLDTSSSSSLPGVLPQGQNPPETENQRSYSGSQFAQDTGGYYVKGGIKMPYRPPAEASQNKHLADTANSQPVANVSTPVPPSAHNSSKTSRKMLSEKFRELLESAIPISNPQSPTSVSEAMPSLPSEDALDDDANSIVQVTYFPGGAEELGQGDNDHSQHEREREDEELLDTGYSSIVQQEDQQSQSVNVKKDPEQIAGGSNPPNAPELNSAPSFHEHPQTPNTMPPRGGGADRDYVYRSQPRVGPYQRVMPSAHPLRGFPPSSSRYQAPRGFYPGPYPRVMHPVSHFGDREWRYRHAPQMYAHRNTEPTDTYPPSQRQLGAPLDYSRRESPSDRQVDWNRHGGPSRAAQQAMRGGRP
ncbi:hypothetical protein M427DRAFT_27648 [Gonapodya prolifera JEL478]|uniref:Uncharacterized protein n=1 Tax=Gonapodya prolifera (strain JEL478) TaxID=1344416 RepID=A0A139AXB9_GONPJ|nr:hypothetical protein M427DRAFT_27648 [Gonapodya prolifera JEL478]|eukprot:KXS21223.1 hypothetical protein M427DRAFT_27648 [Gonapodya prolifera JEL478]